MKTLEQIFNYKGGDNCNVIDGRDKSRLLDFVPVSDWAKLGFAPKENATLVAPLPFTEENVKAALARDLDFAFDKALGQRGISASLMWDVIKMWMWVLDDELQNCNHYCEYGLPLFAAVARKYQLPCPIGEDVGNEDKYSSE